MNSGDNGEQNPSEQNPDVQISGGQVSDDQGPGDQIPCNQIPSEEIPAKAAVAVDAYEESNPGRPHKRSSESKIATKLCSDGTVDCDQPSEIATHRKDGGETMTMHKRNMGKKTTENPERSSKSNGQSSERSTIQPKASAPHNNAPRAPRGGKSQKTQTQQKTPGQNQITTARELSSEDPHLGLLKAFFGSNVKSWLEAQEIHLKREESQKALSSTVESICKDFGLKEDLKLLANSPSAPNPLALILKKCVDEKLLLGTRDLKKFEKELKRFGFDLGTTHLTLKSFMHFSAALELPEIKQLLVSEEWKRIPREFKFSEILLSLFSHGLIRTEENAGNLYSGLPPELKLECGRFDGDLKELIKLRELLEKDSVKKHLNGTRLAGQSPEDRFLSLLLNLVEKEGLDPDTDYRLVYGALPLKRKAELTDSHIKINYLTQLRKALEKDSLKAQLREFNKLSLTPEEKFVEFILTLRNEKLVAPEMRESQIFSALPPKIRSEMKYVEMPYSDIANFRCFFSGQSVQARLHMLLGSDKTPWQRFEELNALLYDPSNEASRGSQKATLPADYFELHSWLPPKLRAATSPIPDEEEVEQPAKSIENPSDNAPQSFTESVLKPVDAIGHSSALPTPISMPNSNALPTSKNTAQESNMQSRVSLSFTPRLGDHSVRQKTSLDLSAYRPSAQSTKNPPTLMPENTLAINTNPSAKEPYPSLVNNKLNASYSQQVDSDFPNTPVQIFEVENDRLESQEQIDSPGFDQYQATPETGNQTENLYRSGRTWGDVSEENPDLETPNKANKPQITEKPALVSGQTIELGFNDSLVQTPGSKDGSEAYRLQSWDSPKAKIAPTQLITNDGQATWGENSQTNHEGSNILADSLQAQPTTRSVMGAESISSNEVVSAVPNDSGLINGVDPETYDSLSDHLTYTATSKISPEERLLEFAVFLNRNKLLATTNSFKELFEKLPADIQPEFKLVDLDLGKFLEFRQDISRHFVKEHLRTTKEKGLEGEDRFAEFIGFLKKNGLMPQLPDSADVYKLIPISLKREFGDVLSTEPVNLELRKNLDMEVVKEYISTLEGASISPEDRLIELGIFLKRNGLLASIEGLMELHAQLPFDMRRAFKRCDANLKVISSIRSILEKEMIKEHLRNTKEANLNDEERFIELVIFLERNELVERGTNPNDIYMALPSQMKGDLKRCDFPSEIVIQVRDCLDKPPVQAQVELLKKMWFTHQEKFMELAVFMRQNGYMPANVDASLLYRGLPANLKKELSVIEMPLDAVVQLRKNLDREFVKAHIKSSENDNLSPEERFVELVVFLYRNELMPDIPTIDDLYTALPAELRLEFSRTEIPLEQILLFRDILDKAAVREHWNRSRNLGGSGEDRFADLVVFLKKEGLLIFEDNLGYFYTALPIEFKRELSNFVFKVETITRLKGAIKAAEASVSF